MILDLVHQGALWQPDVEGNDSVAQAVGDVSVDEALPGPLQTTHLGCPVRRDRLVCAEVFDPAGEAQCCLWSEIEDLGQLIDQLAHSSGEFRLSRLQWGLGSCDPALELR